MSNLRDQIAGANDITIIDEYVPEWNVNLQIRSMTAAERGECIASATNPKTGAAEPSKLYSRVLIASVYDPETGEPAFTSEDEAMLGGKNGSVVERIAGKSMELSGFDSDAEDKAGND